LFETRRVCDVTSNGHVTARKIVVKSVTVGWKRSVWICSVKTGQVDLGRIAIRKVDLGPKRLGTTAVEYIQCWCVIQLKCSLRAWCGTKHINRLTMVLTYTAASMQI